MKLTKSNFCRITLIFTLLYSLLLCLLPSFCYGQATESEKTVDLLFTHDIHSHIESYTDIIDGQKTNIGGFDRIATIIKEQKAVNPDTLVLDGGDFSVGTLYQTLYTSEASELRLLGSLGYDATTLGNHEFDYRSQGLADMLDAAVNSGEDLPSLLVCNIDWSNPTEEQSLLQEAFENYGVKSYEVVERNGVKIALLGVFGKDSLSCAPTCALNFTDPIEAVKETVATIKEQEEVDMIVCLSHSGTADHYKKSEDEQLAAAVPDLDVIISGHTHTKIESPIISGDTYIVSAGQYGNYVGSMSLTKNSEGRWDLSNYKLIPTTPDIPSDQDTLNQMNTFSTDIDTYLSKYNLTKDQVIAQNDISFCTVEDLYYEHTEHTLGDIIADSYRYAIENASSYDGVPVDVALVPSGSIRSSYMEGDLTVSDVFNSFSLGTGPDGQTGYPLITAYVTGKELKTFAEIDASVSDYMQSARLYMSGLCFTYNPNRQILNRVTDIYLVGEDEERIEIQDDQLYRIAADLYSAQMLSAVTDMSYGLLSVVPKDASGTPITDMEDDIVYDNDQELKAWVGIVTYMESFTPGDSGVPLIPEYYASNHNRKVVDSSKNLLAIINHPNKFTAIFAGVIVGGLLILTGIILLIIKLVKHFHRRK